MSEIYKKEDEFKGFTLHEKIQLMDKGNLIHHAMRMQSCLRQIDRLIDKDCNLRKQIDSLTDEFFVEKSK